MDQIIQVGELENGQEIELHPHQMLRVTLAEVRTAGFRWNLSSSKERVCRFVKEDFRPARGIGGTGEHYWEFRAEEVGTTKIMIEYSRAWERASAPARSFSLSVRVT
jgi:predicted secreted protein